MIARRLLITQGSRRCTPDRTGTGEGQGYRRKAQLGTPQGTQIVNLAIAISPDFNFAVVSV